MESCRIIINSIHIFSRFFYVLGLDLLRSSWREMMVIVNSMANFLPSNWLFWSKRNRKFFHPLSFNSLSYFIALGLEKTGISLIWVRNAPLRLLNSNSEAASTEIFILVRSFTLATRSKCWAFGQSDSIETSLNSLSKTQWTTILHCWDSTSYQMIFRVVWEK